METLREYRARKTREYMMKHAREMRQAYWDRKCAAYGDVAPQTFTR